MAWVASLAYSRALATAAAAWLATIWTSSTRSSPYALRPLTTSMKPSACPRKASGTTRRACPSVALLDGRQRLQSRRREDSGGFVGAGPAPDSSGAPSGDDRPIVVAQPDAHSRLLARKRAGHLVVHGAHHVLQSERRRHRAAGVEQPDQPLALPLLAAQQRGAVDGGAGQLAEGRSQLQLARAEVPAPLELEEIQQSDGLVAEAQRHGQAPSSGRARPGTPAQRQSGAGSST